MALLGRYNGWVLLAALLALWELSARLEWVQSENWPAISSIFGALVRGVLSGELLETLGSTLYRMAIGFLVGSGLGIIVGLLMASFKAFDAALEPLVELLRPIPIPAIVPPLILLLGIDDALKIFVVGLATLFPVLVNTVQGVRSVSEDLHDVARTFQRGRIATLFRVVLPASLPYIAAGMRVALAFALIVTIVAEMIAGSAGMGYFLMTMQYAMRPVDMYAGIILLALTGYVLNWVFLRVERRLLPWFHVEAS